MSTITESPLENVSLSHYKLHAGLQTFMKIIGTSGHFSYSEELEKRIVNMKLHLLEDGKEAYTEFTAVFVGLRFPYFDGTLDENYITCKVIVGHEVAHLRLTSKKSWDAFCQTARGKYRKLGNVATDILNIVEDGRIEYHMAKISKFLLDGFFVLRQKMSTKIQDSFDALENPEEMDAFMKINIIRYSILYMVCTLRMPSIQNEDIMEYLKEIYPLVVYSRKTTSTQKAVETTQKIMEILADLQEEMDENGEERSHSSDFGTGSKGSGESTEKDELDDMGSEEDLDKHIPEELKEILDELERKVKEDLEGTDDDTEESGADEEGESEDETDKESKKKEKSTKELVEEIAAKIKESKKEMDEETKEKADEVKKKMLEESMTEEILNDYLKPDEKSEKQKTGELKEATKMKELKPVLNELVHVNCKAEFKSKNEMNTFLPHEYSTVIQPYNVIIKKAAKELEKLSTEAIQLSLRNKRAGRLDKKALIRAGAFNDPKVFTKKKVDIEQLTMDVMLLVDVSGSNYTDIGGGALRYELNRIISMTLHEILKKAKFNHSIWSFEESGDCLETFAPMVDFSNCLQKDAGMYLKDINAYSGNRDGFAIAYAGDYLNQHSTSGKKLLIVLSDGQPSASGYYGPLACKDVRETVLNLEQKDIKTIGIFSGDEHENKAFGEMYKNAIYANNESLKDLPKTLKDLLVQEFKEHVGKI